MIRINIIKKIKVKTYICIKEEHKNMSISEDIHDEYTYFHI